MSDTPSRPIGAPPQWLAVEGGGPRLALRHRPAMVPHRGPPVLFVHGATLASKLYDVGGEAGPSGTSWMAHVAAHGRDAFAVDLRGYGRSERPPSFDAPPDEHPPYCRHDAAVADIARAVDAMRAHTGADRIDLVGGSWGSITSGIYANRHPESLRRLVLFAPIHAEVNEGWLTITADPADRSRPNPALGAYRLVTRAAVRERWDAEIPGADPTAFRPEPVFAALMDEALAGDPRSGEHGPPAMRVPNGTLLDLHKAFSGRPLYDAADIRIPTLLICGDRDPTSTATDMARLAERLPGAHAVTIANASHFAIAERAAPRVFEAAEAFLGRVTEGCRRPYRHPSQFDAR